MNEKPKDFYRVFAPGVPNYRDVSARLSEADAQSRKREILMANPPRLYALKRRTNRAGQKAGQQYEDHLH